MSDSQFRLTLATATTRLIPWFMLAAYAGLRAMEIAALEVEDFNVDDGAVFIHLRVTKGGDERVTAIPLWLWTDVLAPAMPTAGPCWKRLRGDGPVTAQQISQACNSHLHSIGITDKTFHSFRHWAGTQAAELTGDILLTQNFLGHAQPESTNVYAFVRPKRLSAMVESFPRIDVPMAG